MVGLDEPQLLTAKRYQQRIDNLTTMDLVQIGSLLHSAVSRADNQPSSVNWCNI